MKGFAYLAAAGVLGCFWAVPARPDWVVARSPHFEVYSEAGPDRANILLAQFEDLRSFFDRNRMMPSESAIEKRPVLRVVEFRSKEEYDAVRIRAMADAFYTGSADRDYVVMPRFGRGEFGVAAHEYAHFVLHSEGLKLPAWLDEGLAELFSTVSITKHGCELGGALATHVGTLRGRAWLPASELFSVGADSPLRRKREGAALFYAESWALTDLLTSSPEYAPRFGDLVAMLRTGKISSRQAIAKVYGKPPEAVVADAREWIRRGTSSRRTLPSIPRETFSSKVNSLSAFQVQETIADLLFAEGAWDRAAQLYKELLRQTPNDPDLLSSLGSVAMREGDRRDAVEYWRQAFDNGMKSAPLCYGYALLAEEMALPSEEVGRALERAIASQPNFDDARFKLALLKSNAGDYHDAVDQLQAMAKPPAERAFAYWIALANAESELGRREEAGRAAEQAAHFAKSSEEHAQAAELAYVAKTDLAVRFARDADGKMELATTRIPHGTMEFNPFVEDGDQIQVATGTLQNVQCVAGRLSGFVVASNTGTLTLSVADPTHVLMRNSPPEFTCGPQSGRNVKVEYALGMKNTHGVLRGMEFQ